MRIIIILLVDILATLLICSRLKKPKSSRIHSEKTVLKQNQTNTDKTLKQAEREKQQAEKIRQKKEQAKADIEFYQSQLDKITDMLSQADIELTEIEKQIQIDKLMRSYDNATKKEKRKTQLVKHIMTLENRVHAIETKLAKAYYITQAV